ncbi:MAG: hypothetical protein MUD10_02595 [Candidatus Pacebacteria bacterium]|jgi:hypothetical protein|nr:hypothetical protein [Candidatus Paceibacterota bacterium]
MGKDTKINSAALRIKPFFFGNWFVSSKRLRFGLPRGKAKPFAVGLKNRWLDPPGIKTVVWSGV